MLLHLGKSTTSGSLWVDGFQPLKDIQVSHLFPPPELPLVLFRFLAEYVTGQLRLLILIVPCWMEATWLPTVLNMLVDIPHYCPIVISAFNPGCSAMCVAEIRVHFLSLPGSGRGSLSVYDKSYQQLWKEWTRWSPLEGEPNIFSVPKLADFLVHLFRVGLSWQSLYLSFCYFSLQTSSSSQGFKSTYHL